jgi:hypothetical protein
VIIISSIKIKAVKRNIKRRAKFREKSFAVRLHEQSAEAAFELWMESIIASTLQRISHVTGSSVYDENSSTV